MYRSNGLRVFKGAGAALLIGSLLSGTASADVVADRNRGVVELITGADPAGVAMAHDLASLVDDGATRRLLPVVGRGAIDNVIDLKALRGIDMAIVQTDVLDYARQRGMPHLEGSITYVAKLHTEELHLLARADVSSLEELAGKKVVFAGGARVTGPAVLDQLHIKIEPVFEDQGQALAKLRSGEVVAMAYVAAKPTPLFGGLSRGDGLHYLAVPFAPDMAANYVPAQLTAEDYPQLIAPESSVDTLAVGTTLMVANLTPNTERYRNVANFVDAFFTLLPRLQEAAHHPKWREVNVAAELAGWRRFPPADIWLKRNLVASAPAVDETQMREIFARFLDERAKASGSRTLTAEQKGQLFEQFQSWQRGKAR
jgi:TRAP-type uncharacterized transport system substrate-binding protein